MTMTTENGGRRTERTLSVPLDAQTREALAHSARSNGRAAGREAARLIRDGLAREAER